MVTQSQLERATAKVKRELRQLGFWTKRLDKVTVTRMPLTITTLGLYDNGAIRIPTFTLLPPFRIFSKRYGLVETLRHEFGHAVYEMHPGIVRKLGFARVFHGAYENRRWSHQYSSKYFVSWYAARFPCEDFAEVFALYVRTKGQLPSWAKHPAIRAKWNFIERVRRSLVSKYS